MLPPNFYIFPRNSNITLNKRYPNVSTLEINSLSPPQSQNSENQFSNKFFAHSLRKFSLSLSLSLTFKNFHGVQQQQKHRDHQISLQLWRENPPSLHWRHSSLRRWPDTCPHCRLLYFFHRFVCFSIFRFDFCEFVWFFVNN